MINKEDFRNLDSLINWGAYAEALEEENAELTKVFTQSCQQIADFEEPLCTLDECNDEYESCRQCKHSICTVDEWKEYFMKGEFKNEI